MAGQYEHFDHTADIGIRARGDTATELLRASGDGFYAVIGELHPIGPARAATLEFAAEEQADLLRDYLAELLVLFECERRMVVGMEVETFDERRLVVTVRMADVDPDRSVYHGEVKAVTYHELAVRRTELGYEATVIVDI